MDVWLKRAYTTEATTKRDQEESFEYQLSKNNRVATYDNLTENEFL